MEGQAENTRKLKLETSATIKINTGNYETIDVTKTVTMDIEFSKPSEVIEKSKKLDSLVANLAKAEAETILKETGRFMTVSTTGGPKKTQSWDNNESTE